MLTMLTAEFSFQYAKMSPSRPYGWGGCPVQCFRIALEKSMSSVSNLAKHIPDGPATDSHVRLWRRESS